MNTLKRMETLAKFLECDIKEIGLTYLDYEFKCKDQEYMVLTENEADHLACSYIDDSICYFKPSFIAEYTKLPKDYAERIIELIQADYEKSNDALWSLIGNNDVFLKAEAIGQDGFGHFLNSYDGKTYEHDGLIIIRTE